MKIIYMHQYFTTPDMPGGTRSYEFARRFVAAGHRVEMITGDYQNRFGAKDWTETTEAGIHVHWAPVPYSNKLTFYQRLRAFFRFARMAAQRGIGLDGDVVFATSTPLTICLPGAKVARKKRIPMVFEVRDLWPKLPIAMGELRNPIAIAGARWLERYAYRHAKRIVALCPGFKEAIIKTGYPADNIALIPNSCDFEIFDVGPEPGRAFRARTPWLQDRPLITYTGTMGKANDVGYMVKVAQAMAGIDPEVRFLVVGSGRSEEQVRALARESGVYEKSFFMLPPINKSEIPAIFSAATLPMVTLADFPDLWHNSSNKFFDTLASRKPVAINYGGWEADAIRENDCGLVLDPKDPAGAARRIADALHNPAWLAAAGERAGQLGRERFDRNKLASQLIQVLQDAVDAGR